MNILIIDGQGGNLGRQLAKTMNEKLEKVQITVVGTNSIATANMLKAGNVVGATGENAVIVNARKADVIIGPIGIVIADSLYGEITKEMAYAVSSSNAKRILIPMNRCDNIVVGVSNQNLSQLIEEAVEQLAGIMAAERKC